VPVSRKKTGAQKGVIQRVKKRGMVVVARSVGLTRGAPKKSRVVIEGHEDHDRSAEHVHRFQANPMGSTGGAHGRKVWQEWPKKKRSTKRSGAGARRDCAAWVPLWAALPE
jgi:hypothetical protein